MVTGNAHKFGWAHIVAFPGNVITSPAWFGAEHLAGVDSATGGVGGAVVEVNEFAAIPEEPGKLATKIKSLDDVILVNSCLIKPPLGQFIEIQSRDPIAGTFTRLKVLARKHQSNYSVWIELGTKRENESNKNAEENSTAVEDPQFFEHTFLFKEGSGNATFNFRSGGETVLGVMWEEKTED